MNARIGDNNPPGPIEHAESVVAEANAWLADHPVIQTEDEAREAKPIMDRLKLAFEEIEAERDGKVRPLNEQVKAINERYKSLHNTDAKKPGRFDRVAVELKARFAAYMLREEEKRRQAAEAARKAKEEAERVAREAEAAEREALQNAAAGELDIDVAKVTAEADDKFQEYERVSRFAERAEKETTVKIGGGFRTSASLRTVETLVLDSYGKAIRAIGPNEKIEAAILSAARDYRKTHGVLPDGVSATTERKL